MSESLILQLAKDALTVSMLVAGPILVVSLLVGVLVSIFQAVTSIQDMTLTFVPKTLAVSLSVLLFGPWMLSTMTAYTANLLSSLPSFAH